MAINALQSSASALSALNTALDVTANNLANINTSGFKTSRVNFQDLLYIEKAQPGSVNANSDQRPIGTYVGLGVKVAGTQLDLAPGAPQATDRQFDVMINGKGFFEVSVQDSIGPGGKAYTRAGHFTTNSDGELVLADDQGRRVQPGISIPSDATDVTITSEGKVLYTTATQATQQDAGTITLATFINPTGLKQVGGNLYVETGASGPATTGDPNSDGRGSLQQGFLESSNVDPTKELIELIRTQRAFEMNSQSIRTADETLRAAAQLKR
jgi:flagellar basal-body rod protein FlgG